PEAALLAAWAWWGAALRAAWGPRAGNSPGFSVRFRRILPSARMRAPTSAKARAPRGRRPSLTAAKAAALAKERSEIRRADRARRSLGRFEQHPRVDPEQDRDDDRQAERQAQRRRHHRLRPGTLGLDVHEDDDADVVVERNRAVEHADQRQ